METTLFLLSVILACWWWFVYKKKTLRDLLRGGTRDSTSDRGEQRLQQTASFVDRRLEEIRAEHVARQRAAQVVGAAELDRLDYMDGYDFEDFVGKLYTAQGYSVTVTKKSGDYGVDLLLNGKGRRIAVQVKRWQGSVGVRAIQEALAGKLHYSCNDAMVVTNSTFTKQAKDIAKSTGVQLVDRNGLAILIGNIRDGVNRG